MILGDNEANKELYREEAGKVYFVEMGNSKALADKITELANERRQQEGVK